MVSSSVELVLDADRIWSDSSSSSSPAMVHTGPVLSAPTLVSSINNIRGLSALVNVMVPDIALVAMTYFTPNRHVRRPRRKGSGSRIHLIGHMKP